MLARARVCSLCRWRSEPPTGPEPACPSRLRPAGGGVAVPGAGAAACGQRSRDPALRPGAAQRLVEGAHGDVVMADQAGDSEPALEAVTQCSPARACLLDHGSQHRMMAART